MQRTAISKISRSCCAVLLSLAWGCMSESEPAPQAAAVEDRFVEVIEPAELPPRAPEDEEPEPVAAGGGGGAGMGGIGTPAKALKVMAKPAPRKRPKKLPKDPMVRKRVRVAEQRVEVQKHTQRAVKLEKDIAELKVLLERKKLDQLRGVARRKGWTPTKRPTGDLRRVWQDWVKLEMKAAGKLK